MNTDTLRTWLGLPAGPWPPDDRTLLGLAAGPITAHLIEERALAQMEKLRPHQLMQPELVTEGMNRLAQALDTLTVALAPPPPPPAPVTIAPQPRAPVDDSDIVLDADKLKPPTVSAAVQPTTVLDAEVILAPKPRIPKPKRKRPKTQPRKRQEPPSPAVEVPEVEPLPPGMAFVPAKRRAGYAELVAMRKVMEAWGKLQPWFAVPSEGIETPAAVYSFLVAVRECRRVVAIEGQHEWFAKHGSMVLTILRNPMALAVFRTFVRSQRQSIATDWAYTAAMLKSRYEGLREELNATKPRRAVNKLVRRTRAWMRENPEWLLAGVLVLLWLFAFIRTARSPG